jgi:hypothetical protein
LRNGAPIGKLTDKPLRTFALWEAETDIWINPHLAAGPD